MLLSVIIPTCNRNDFLARCLDCLQPTNQTLDASKYEVIVTDDGKNGQAEKLVQQYPWAKWVKGPQKGPASNRNNGARLAQYEWLVFVDDDCLPANIWLEGYANAIAQYGNSIKVFEGLTDADKPRERFDEESPVNLTGGFLWSCNFAILKSYFLELGGFDELFPFPAMEDTDLHVRIKKTQQIQFVSEAKVIHPWRVITPFKGYRKWVASHTYFAKKHGTYGTISYRYSRTKIFAGDIFRLFKELSQFSYKGIGFYFERLLFDFLMIFA